MMLLHQQFLQAQSTDTNCKGLVRNETLGGQEKGVVLILQVNMIWRLPITKIAKTVSSVNE